MKRYVKAEPTDPRVVEVLMRHARVKGGRAVRCKPTAYERKMRAAFGNTIVKQNKVIYDTQEAAMAAACEFAAINGGLPGKVYPCQRSKSGHCHITTVRF